MYGVVLWSDVLESKAVFWCEDQGDLAFFHAVCDDEAMDSDAGDLVQFDVYLDCRLRKARNPVVVQEKARVDLPDQLLRHQSLADAEPHTAEVYQFPVRTDPHYSDRQLGTAQKA